MNDVIVTLKSRRNELALELGRIDKAITILSNGSGASANGNTTRGPKPMSAAMKAKIGRGVRKAFLHRKREAVARSKYYQGPKGIEDGKEKGAVGVIANCSLNNQRG